LRADDQAVDLLDRGGLPVLRPGPLVDLGHHVEDRAADPEVVLL